MRLTTAARFLHPGTGVNALCRHYVRVSRQVPRTCVLCGACFFLVVKTLAEITIGRTHDRLYELRAAT